MTTRKGHSGRVYYDAQGGQGSITDPCTLPLPFWANVRVREISNLAEVRAGGSRNPVELQEGMFGVEWGVDHPKIQGTEAGKAWYDLVVSSGGDPDVLTWFTLGYGDDRACWNVQDCKMGNLEFSWEAGETAWLTGRAGGFGGLVTEPGTDPYEAQTYIDTPGFAYHEAQHSTYEMTGGSCTMDQGLAMKPVILGPAGTRTQRVWDYLTEGDETVSGTYRLTNHSGVDMNAAVIATSNQALHFINKAAGTDVISLEWAGLGPTSEEMTIPGGDGDIEWEFPWIASDFAFELAYP